MNSPMIASGRPRKNSATKAPITMLSSCRPPLWSVAHNKGIRLLHFDGFDIEQAKIGILAAFLFCPIFETAVPHFIEGFCATIVSDENIAIRRRCANNCLGFVVAAGHVFAAAVLDYLQSLGQILS